MMKTQCAVAAVLCWMLLASGGASAEGGYLSGADLPKAIIGKSLASTTKRGIPYVITFEANGTGTNKATNGRFAEPIKWDIKDDVICFHGTLAGTECNKVRSVGGKYDFIDSRTGSLNNTYTVP
jgi:hypothetical protein